MKKFWKRNSIVAAIVLFVCAAVYLNWSYSQDTQAGKTLGEAALVAGKSEDPLLKPEKGTEPDAKAKQDDGKAQTGDSVKGTESGYFSAARLNRQQARDSALSLLQDAAADEKATAETMKEANLAIQSLADYTLAEAQIENLVTAKGYTNCVAFLNENSISVVVSALENGITDTDVAKIGEIVMEQTNLNADQIKIIEAD